MIDGLSSGLSGTYIPASESPRRRDDRPATETFAPLPVDDRGSQQSRRENLSARPVLPSTSSDRPRLSRDDGTDLPMRNREAVKTYQQVQQQAAPPASQDASQLAGVDVFA